MKRKTLISSILVIVLCLGLISGSTYALFTSEDSVNIAITSGKVNVTAAIKDLTLYSATANKTGLTDEELADEAGTLTGTFAGTYYYKSMPVENNEGEFLNKGTATLTNTKTLVIDRITPGDKVEVTVSVENNSNVKTKYRIRVNVLEGENAAKSLKLFEGLTVNVGTNETRTATKLNGVIRVSDWYDLAARGDNDNLADVPVEIFLPLEAGNEYQDLKTEIQITVEAVQSNAATNTELKTINAFLANQTPTTMYAAVKSLADNSVLGLTSYAAAFAKVESYLWNVDTNQFYAESDATDFAYKYFKGYDEMPTAQTYSIYAKAGWDVDEVTGLTVGFDAGETSNITIVTYDRSSATDERDVVIRTNSFGTTLTINAPKDTVKHYGEAKKVDVVAIANASYHENGTVQLIAVKEGHVKLDGDADVNGVYIYTDNASAGFEDIKITVDAGVEIPTLSRSAVVVQEGGTKVCTVVTDQAKDIYLFNEGIYEQIKTVDVGKNIATDASAKWADDDNANTANTQNAAQQLANEFNGSYDGNGKIADQVVEVTAGTYTVKFNQDTREFETYQGDTKVTETTVVEAVAEVADVASESGKTAAQAAQAAMFKGEGTESSPYEINNGNDWYNLLTKYQGLYMGSSTNGLYVILKGDIDMTGYDISSYNSYPRNFHLDGNGFTMKNFETSIWGDDGTLYLTNTFTNLKLDNCHSSNNSLFGGTQNSNTASVTFNNVDLNNCSAVGGAYQYYDGSATATFIDCDATNTNVLGGYMASGGFVGNISTGVLVIDHCSFGGSVVSTESACGGFIGQSANYDPNKITIKDSTIIAGTVIRNVAGGNVAAFNAHTGTQDYAQFNNSFYGTLETTGTKYKQGTNAAEKTYEPICTAADFTLNSVEGTLTYNGSAGLGKIAVQVYVIDDYIYNGKYYGGYNYYVCDPIKANNIVNGTTIPGIPVITDFYNVVSSTDTPVGLQTTDTTYVDEIHNGTFYFDAQTYSWGHYMLGGTYKDGSAVVPTSLNVYIKITVYDNSDALIGVVSGATLKYTVDLSNHSN